MKQYLDVLKKILNEGVEKESGRANMPNTFGISSANIKMDLSEGFPLLTTKKMHWKGIVHELIWFLRGETNIKYLVDNNINIWNDDAYRWYLKHFAEWKSETEYFNNQAESEDEKTYHNEEPLSKENFKKNIKDLPAERLENWFSDYTLGDLGKVYGYQWRNQNGVDQVKEVLNSLKNNPYSRYHIIDGWNKTDFKEMALPPCHLLYQFIVRPLSFDEKIKWVMENLEVDMENVAITEAAYGDNVPKFYLDLNMYQRSCDTPLGVPYNIASMSLLLMLFAKVNNMVPGVSNWIGGDTHIYVNQIETVKEQVKREPMDLPQMNICREITSLEDIENLSIDDFELVNYKSHPSIKYELSVGLVPSCKK